MSHLFNAKFSCVLTALTEHNHFFDYISYYLYVKVYSYWRRKAKNGLIISAMAYLPFHEATKHAQHIIVLCISASFRSSCVLIYTSSLFVSIFNVNWNWSARILKRTWSFLQKNEKQEQNCLETEKVEIFQQFLLEMKWMKMIRNTSTAFFAFRFPPPVWIHIYVNKIFVNTIMTSN